MVHTDNEALVHVLMRRSSKHRSTNVLLRDLSLLTMSHNFVLQAVHIPGADNVLADALSRLQVEEFREITRGTMQAMPLVIPNDLLPSSCKNRLRLF